MEKECLLCLEVNKEFVHYMNVYAEEWSDHDIKSLIEKHLWPVDTLKSHSPWLCTACWKVLHDFHQFYRRIEDVQAYFDHVDKSDRVETEEFKLTEFENIRKVASSDNSECDLYSLLGNQNNYEEEPQCRLSEKSVKATEFILNEKTSDIIVPNFITELYKCHICGKLFKNQDILSKHTAWHKGTICSCEICDLKYFDLSQLIQHKRIHIPKEKSLNTTNHSDDTTIPQETNDSFVNFYCEDFDYTETEMEQDISSMPSTSNNFSLVCTHCFKVFVSQKTMANHMAWHKGEVYKCKICDLQFFDEHKYNAHNMTHEIKKTSDIASKINDSGSVEKLSYNYQERGFKCKYCSNVYDNKKVYLNHIAWHEGNIFHCTICDLKFLDAYKFYKHKSTHDLNSNQTCDTNNGESIQLGEPQQDVDHMYQEQIAVKSSTGFKKLKMSVIGPPQIEDDHPPQELSINDTYSPLAVEKSDDAIGIQENDASNNDISQIIEVECTFCYKVLENERVLLKHMAWHEHMTFQCDMCEMKFFDKSIFEQHIAAHAAETPEGDDDDSNIELEYFMCSFCSRVLNSRRLFLYHNAWHLNTFHKCEICDLQFLDKTKYEDHKDTHLPKSWKRCRDCGKVFAGPSDVKRHWEKMHRNKFVKICDICGMMYRCPLAFKRHTDKHKGYTAPKTPCDICGRLLKGINSLRAHKFIHHPKNGILPYNCHICLKGLATRSLLNRHITVRHGTKDASYKCMICDKAFKSQSCLREHSDSHNSEAKYSCQWCSKTFYRNTYLSRHRKKDHPKEYEEWKSQLFVKI